MTEPSDELDRPETRSNHRDSVEDAIETIADLLVDHPGFMTSATGGIEVLHADWPAYPLGHGRRAALLTLAEYPNGTEFIRDDNIDHCTLMSVGRELTTRSGMPVHLFVAAWDRDLLALAQG